jgi:hypothetical protein
MIFSCVVSFFVNTSKIPDFSLPPCIQTYLKGGERGGEVAKEEERCTKGPQRMWKAMRAERNRLEVEGAKWNREHRVHVRRLKWAGSWFEKN